MKQKKIQRKSHDEDGGRGKDDTIDTSQEGADDSDGDDAGFDSQQQRSSPVEQLVYQQNHNQLQNSSINYHHLGHRDPHKHCDISVNRLRSYPSLPESDPEDNEEINVVDTDVTFCQ